MSPEERRAYHRTWAKEDRKKNPEKYRKSRREYMARWRKEHPDETKTVSRQFRERHKDKLKKINKEKRDRNRPRLLERLQNDRLYRAKRMLTGVKSNAQKRNIECDLTINDVTTLLTTDVCAITGLPLNYETGRGRPHPRGPSIDRIDSSRGYTANNIQVVCYQVNVAKGEWTLDFLSEVAKAIVVRGIV
jgi:hypothetical protein